LRLQQRGAVGTRIDIHQRIAGLYELTLLIVDGHDQPSHLARNRSGINRGYRTDGVEIDADAALLSRGTGYVDPRRRFCRQGRCLFRSFLAVAQVQ
jgi:hypothetical protein